MPNLDELRRILSWQMISLMCITAALCLISSSASNIPEDKEPSADLTVLQEHFKLIHDIYAAVGAEKKWNFPREKGKRFRRSLDIHPVSLALRAIGQSHSSAASVNENVASVPHTAHSEGSVGDEDHGGNQFQTTTSWSTTLSQDNATTRSPNANSPLTGNLTNTTSNTTTLPNITSTSPPTNTTLFSGNTTTLPTTLTSSNSDVTSNGNTTSNPAVNQTSPNPVVDSTSNDTSPATGVTTTLATTAKNTTTSSNITTASLGYLTTATNVTDVSPTTNPLTTAYSLSSTNESSTLGNTSSTNVLTTITSLAPLTTKSAVTALSPVTTLTNSSTSSSIPATSNPPTNETSTQSNASTISTVNPQTNSTLLVPVTTQSSATSLSTVTNQSLVTNQSSATSLSPVTNQSLVTNQSSATSLSSVTNQSLVTNQSSATTLSPVTNQSLVTNQSSATTLSPVTTQSPASTQSPVVTQSANATLSPNETQSVATTLSTTTLIPTTPITYYPPSARITGSRSIGQCGVLDMSGLGSRDSTGQQLRYVWSVSSEGNMTQLIADLELLNAENEGYGNPQISLPGNVLADENVGYEFNLTVINFVNLSDWATFDVRRLSDPIFDVFITTLNVDELAVKRSKSVSLRAKTVFYTECMTPTFVAYAWECDDAYVQGELQNQYNRIATIPAYTLPLSSTTACTVTVSEAADSSRSNNVTIYLTTVTSNLVANIKGSTEFSVGIESGLVQLDGDQSYDPELTSETMVYQWTCVQITDNTDCISRVTNETFPGNSTTTLSALSFNASHMFPQMTYRFALAISKDTRTAQDYVDIFAKGEVIPIVAIEVVGSNGGSLSASNTINIRADISHTIPLDTLVWSTVAETWYKTITLDDQTMWSPVQTVSTGIERTISQIFLKPDALTSASNYKFTLIATTQTGASATALVEIRTYSGVLGCQLTVPDYTILDEVGYTISGCYADDDGYPLNYALAVVSGPDDTSQLRSLSQRSTAAANTFVGRSTWDGSGNATFVATVCDQLGSCLSVSDDVVVTEAVEFTAEEVQQNVEAHVLSAIYLKEYLKALLNYVTITNAITTSSPSRKRRAVEGALSAQEINDNILKYVRAATAGEVLNDDNTPVILEQIQYLDLDLLNSTQRETLVDVANTLVGIFLGDGAETISTANIEILFQAAEGLLRIENYTDSTLRDLIDDIGTVLTKTAITGGDPVEHSSDDVIYTVQKNLPCVTFQVTSQNGGADIDFGDEVCSSYGPSWTSNSSTYYGVSVQTRHYQDSATFDSIGVGYINNTASSLLDVSLANPDTGDAIAIQDLTSPITITLNISIQQEFSYICKYWDEDLSEWSTDGVDTYENRTGDLVECRTTHLTTFVVVTEDRVLTTAISTAAGEVETAATTETKLPTTNQMATTDTSTTASFVDSNASSDNRVVKVVVPIVVCVVILIFIGVGAIVIYQKKNSKVHMQRLRQGEHHDTEEGGSSQQPRSGSPWGFGKVSPAPWVSDGLSDSSRSSSPIRPPHSPEPKEFLPPTDVDGQEATLPAAASFPSLKKNASPPPLDGRRITSGNRVSPAPMGSNVSLTSSRHQQQNQKQKDPIPYHADGRRSAGGSTLNGSIGIPTHHGSTVSLASASLTSNRPIRPPHSPEPTEFLAPIDGDDSRPITILTPVDTDC